MKPTTLRDLHVGLVGGSEAVRRGLGQLCELTAIGPATVPDDLVGRPRHFIVVEGGEQLDDRHAAHVDRVLDACERAEIPRILWITTSPFDPRWLARCSRFDRVFAVDHDHPAVLERAGAHVPTALPLATSLPIDDELVPGTRSRPVAVLWLGGWRHDWPAGWRDRLTSMLRAAALHGLRIVGLDDSSGLPSVLRDCICPASEVGGSRAELLDARLVLASDPVTPSPRVSPPIAFDALACGAAAVSPHDFGVRAAGLWFKDAVRSDALRTERNLVPAVFDQRSAEQEIERLLGDDHLREATVQHGRRVVAYNHTYANRLATLASAIGYRLVPDANA